MVKARRDRADLGGFEPLDDFVRQKLGRKVEVAVRNVEQFVANRPADAALIEASHSDGLGLLADDGVSVSNLFTGDAPTAYATMSAIGRGQETRESRRTISEFLSRPAGFARSLTPQELQVALTVAAGISNREAAASLFLSEKTVEYHLSNVYRKLGLRSRAALVRRVAELA